MKKITFLLFAVFIFSCNDKSHNTTNAQEPIPEALQDNKSNTLEFISKRAYQSDLVEELYEELEEKNPALKEIKKQLESLDKAKKDTLSILEKFFNKNEDYYRSATFHINKINDSALRQEMISMIKLDKELYKSKEESIMKFIDRLDNEYSLATDRYTVMKLVTSLKMMNQFRNDHTPSSNTLEQLIKDYKNLNKKMDSVITKNK